MQIQCVVDNTIMESTRKKTFSDILKYSVSKENNFLDEWPCDILLTNDIKCKDSDVMIIIRFANRSTQIKQLFLEKYTKFYQPQFAVLILNISDLIINDNALNLLNKCLEDGHRTNIHIRCY